MLQASEIPLIRLESQHIGSTEFSSPRAVVSWMVAMQAQDFPLGRWAIGVRRNGSTEKGIDQAIDQAEIIRTHLLRPTWHFVSAEDIYWLLELTAPQVKASQRAREKQLELTREVYSQSTATIEKALKLHGQLTRPELMVELENAGIATGQNRAAHLLMRAELDQVICSGALRRGKPSYALLADRVPKARRLSKADALAELAERYFTSRYPATLQDFTWWSGLSAGDARQALESVKSLFFQEQIDGKVYWLPQNFPNSTHAHRTAYLLPDFDEYLLSYSDRSASIRPELEQHMKAISNRGVFWPVMVMDGQVIGTWKRSTTKASLIFEIQPFIHLDDENLALLEKAMAQFAKFVDLPTAIRLPTQNK